MSDIRLILYKHARVCIPMIGLLIVLAGIRMFSEELVVIQVYSIGVMLLFVGLTVYAYDSIMRLSGLAADRLLLLSPSSRFVVALKNIMVLFFFFILAALPMLAVQMRYTELELYFVLVEFVSYLIAVLSGCSAVLCVTYLMKHMRRKTPFLLSVWSLLSFLFVVGVVSLIAILQNIYTEPMWLLGATSALTSMNVYVFSIPLTILRVESLDLACACMGTNLLMTSLFALIAGLLAKRKLNFITLG